MNVGAAWRAWRRPGAAVQLPPQQAAQVGAAVARSPRRSRVVRVAAWLLVAFGFGLLSRQAFVGDPAALPAWLKQGIDAALSPISVFLGALAALTALFLGRRFFAIPAVAWAGLNVSLLFLGLSLADANFASNVLQPDNVPIVGMVYLLGFFPWWAAAQAVENDRRQAAGLPPVEKDFAEKSFVWPDLVYIELICAILVTALLIVWSLGVRAPLEQPANPAITPNPSKAPWYFLGLQEMLVYSDAWLAGVVVPLLIIVGLAAIPYLDRKRGRQRLLHDRPAAIRLRGVPLRFPYAVDSADPRRHLLPRAELGLLRALRSPRSAERADGRQRQAFGVVLDSAARPRPAASPGRCRFVGEVRRDCLAGDSRHGLAGRVLRRACRRCWAARC